MLQNDKTGPGNIKKFSISSNGGGGGGGSVDMSAGVVEYCYYESVLTNTISATATIIETGAGEKGVLDSLPIRGGEKAEIEVEDAQQNKIQLNVDFHVNRVRDADPGTQQDLYFIDFASKEFFQNEQRRVTER